jgi:hypothetical protein
MIIRTPLKPMFLRTHAWKCLLAIAVSELSVDCLILF